MSRPLPQLGVPDPEPSDQSNFASGTCPCRSHRFALRRHAGGAGQISGRRQQAFSIDKWRALPLLIMCTRGPAAGGKEEEEKDWCNLCAWVELRPTRLANVPSIKRDLLSP